MIWGNAEILKGPPRDAQANHAHGSTKKSALNS